MIIPVVEARQLMGKASKKYSDSQLEEIINIFDFLAGMAIDVYLIKRKKSEVKSNDRVTTTALSKQYEQKPI